MAFFTGQQIQVDMQTQRFSSQRGKNHKRDQWNSDQQRKHFNQQHYQDSDGRIKKPGKPFQTRYMESNMKYVACPGCRKTYDMRSHLPMFLHCYHTVCRQCLQTPNSTTPTVVRCSECNQTSGLRRKGEDVSDSFEINYYLVGQMFIMKPRSPLAPVDAFQPAGTNITYTKELADHPTSTGTATKRCSYMECTNESTLHCSDCKEYYCNSCSDKMHSSAKGLKSHKITPMHISECKIHTGFVKEFACMTCEGNYCSYCIILKHNGHLIKQLTKVEETEVPRIKALMKDCESSLKKLKETQKIVNSQLVETDLIRVKSAVNKCFMALHNKLQHMEIDWHNKIDEGLKENLESMVQIRQQLKENIDVITDLLSVGKELCTKSQNTKHDVTLVLEQLENARKLVYEFKPHSYAPDDELKEFLETLMKHLEERSDCLSCDVGKAELLSKTPSVSTEKLFEEKSSDATSISSKSTNSKYDVIDIKLKNRDPFEETHKWVSRAANTPYDSDVDSSTSKGAKSKQTGIKLKKRENVTITHVDNPHCVYLHLIRQAKEIEAFHESLSSSVKALIAGPVSHVTIGNLYLAKCHSAEKPDWCRVRLIGVDERVPENKAYEVFYIDYGSSAKLKPSELRNLPNSARVPPYSFQCRIKGIFPANEDWESNTNKLMAEMLSDCHVLMIVFGENYTVLEIDLVAYTTNGEWSVRDTLIFTGHALSYDPINLNTSRPALKTPIPKFLEGATEMKPHTSSDVIITHVKDPHSFYVQLNKYEGNLESLTARMFEYYQHKKKGFIYTPSEGYAVAVKTKRASNTTWYRGTITTVKNGKGVVEVFLVDVGTVRTVNWYQLRKLSDSFLSVMSLALHVKLKDIIPANGDAKWTDTAINFLNTYKEEKRVLKMTVHSVTKEVLEITLFEIHATQNVCINSLMVDNGVASSSGHLSLVVSFPHLDEEEQEEPETFTVDLLKTSQGKDQLDDDSDTEDYSDYKFRLVKVLSIKNPGCIYVHFPEDRNIMDKLAEVHASLQMHHRKIPLENKPEWEEKEFGIAFSEEDKQYYRISIESKLGNDKYTVFSRDYAHSFNVSGKRIGVVDVYFMNEPPIAYRCHLSGIRPIGTTWSLTSSDFLKELMLQKKNLYFSKVGVMDPSTLSVPALFCLKTCKPPSALQAAVSKWHNINKKLVANGLAINVASNKRKTVKTVVEPVKPEVNEWFKPPIALSNSTENENLAKPASVTTSSNDLEDQFSPSHRNSEQSSEYSIDLLSKSYDFDNKSIEDREVLPSSVQNTKIIPTNEGSWPPAFPVLGRKFTGIATYVDENAHIYFHYVSEIDTLSAMENYMTSYFSVSLPDQRHTFKINEICSVKFRNDKWYRGLVVGFNESENEIQVCMVDYGNVEEVTIDCLRKEIMYSDVPVIAKKVLLWKVYPKTGQFNTSEIDILHKLIVDKEISGDIVDSINMPPRVNLRKNIIDINTYMVNEMSNCTTEPPEISYVLEEEDVIVEDEFVEFKQDALPKDPLFDITIINILDQGRIIFEINKFTERHRKEFEKLSSQLMAFGEEQPTLLDLQLEYPCIAKFTQDNQWYRGRIFKITRTKISVLFVDYGNIDIVSRDDIREIKPEWLLVPVPMYIAYLNYFKDLEKDIVAEIVFKYLGTLLNEIKRVKVLSNSPLTVDIYERTCEKLVYEEAITEGVIG